MAGQSSLREDLNTLRRREWERRNQEAQQYRELYEENTPLFGEPYKTNKGDELSILIRKMLGNYEEGNSCQYDGVIKDCAPVPTTSPPCSSLSSSSASYGRLGRSSHRDKSDPQFQKASSCNSPHPAQREHSLCPPSASQPEFPLARSKDAPPDVPRRTPGTRLDGRERSTMLSVLPDLTPPADPLSPLHSSESSDSEPEDARPLSPVRSEEPLRCPQAQKEASGEALPPTSQSFPLPLSSKPSLTNSRKPMALVRPMDGPEQVSSESPDLKPSPEDFHRQSYEGMPELKTPNKPRLPPLKMPAQSVEVLSSEVHCVEDILREMTHSWPPLLTAIHTPSTAELSRFSFPSKETRVHSTYHQPQKHHQSPPRVSTSPCGEEPAACEDGAAASAVLAPSSGAESGSSSDSDSSSGSESDSESSESGVEERTHDVRRSTSPVKTKGTKDINWQLISWIKENPPNSQNHDDVAVGRNTKTTTSTKSPSLSRPAEDSKFRSKRHYNSHTAPLQQPGFSHAAPESEPLASGQPSGHKPAVSRGNDELVPRKTVGTKHPGGKGRKPLPLPEASQAGLQVESVEVTPHEKDSTFTDRPKVKTKTTHEKSGSKSVSLKQAKQAPSDRREGKDTPPKATVTVEERKEAEPAPSPSPPSQRPRSPPPKSRGGTGGSRTEMLTPIKYSKKSRKRDGSPRKRDGLPRVEAETSRVLLVKIELGQLSRVPQPPKAAKPSRAAAPLDAVKQKAGQEKDPGTTGKAGKKRPAEKTQASVPRKKVKLEKESRPPSSSSQHGSGKIQTLKTTSEEKEVEKRSKSSKKAHAPLPQEQLKRPATGHKRHPEEQEESGSLGLKHRRKSSSKQVDHSKSSKKKALKTNVSPPEPATSCITVATHRPLLQFDDKQHSVDYHMKEAKKLKHRADATLDKMGKAFNYLDAAMSFVESGIAIETDPQTPKSAYTMLSETVDLIRFILKLKNYLEISAPASERDFLVLCMRCQALLQMAMFRCKRDSALKYSRTLADHFKNSKTVHASPSISKSTGTPSPMSPTPSPVSSASCGGITVAIPQAVQQMACSYVNITALFLSAHDAWEQADDLARRGSGLLNELDRTLGQLSLTSSMGALVRYTRQGLHWLKLDSSL